MATTEDKPRIIRAIEIEDAGSISTGLPQLDRITGVGGLPKGFITEIVGQPSVGKTTLCLMLVREAQKQGVECVWADVEWSWESEYAERLGVDLSSLGVIRQPYSEQVLDLLEEDARENKGKLYVIDSVGGLHSQREAEKSSGEKVIAGQAGPIATFVRKIVPLAAMNNHAVIFINHEYKEIGSQYPVWLPSGGTKLAFHKSLSIRLKQSFEGAAKLSKKVGMVVEAEIMKNKRAGTKKQTCSIEMIYGEGFNPVSDLLQDALDKGVIVRTGNTFFMGETKLGMKSKVAELMKEEDFISQLKQELENIPG